MLVIALSKGRFLDPSLDLLSKAGIHFTEDAATSRKLIFTSPDERFRAVLVKPADVPTYVEYGAADVGIAGQDVIMESRVELLQPLDLNFGHCKIAIAAPLFRGQPPNSPNSKNLGIEFGEFGDCPLNNVPTVRIATKYPNITAEYYNSRGIPVEIIPLSGSIELAPLIGLADRIVDLVETGRTLKENGLEVIEIIAESSAKLLINRAAYQTKRDEVLALIHSRESDRMRIIDLTAKLDLREVDAALSSSDTEHSVDKSVQTILQDVAGRGDEALCDYTLKFDNYELTPALMRVPDSDIDEYAAGADDELVAILEKAIINIREYHEHQKQESWEFYGGDGVRLGVRVTPVARAGIYIPGGKAAYPSSVLMNAIPAQVAGVSRIVVVTPPRSLEENPLVAAALNLLGLREVYRIGGAQAIGALAYGTETVPRVDKIVGPGNQYVQAAKRQVYGMVDIDMVAGPSEVAIVADESCDPAWIAADMLAQAEHDEMAGVWLICWSKEVAAAVFDEVQAQLDTLDRSAIARLAILNNGITFIVRDEVDAIELVNHIAPEHAEVLMSEPDKVSDGIRNAGAVFIGRYAPTVVGDYFAGPSHVLPTNRTARFFSPLGVPDFLKRTSIIRYSGRAIERFGEMIEKFAIAEGLTGHARSITIRRR